MQMDKNKPKQNGTTSLTICEIELVALKPLPKGCSANPTTLGQFLKQYRLVHGYTASEIAIELDVFDSTIYKWEYGISYPRKENTKKIIEFMGYDPRINNPLKIENYELT